MSYQEITKNRIADIVNNHAEYNFPQYLRALRESLGIPRMQAAKQTGIQPLRLYFLEWGRFLRDPLPEEIRILAEFYGIRYKTLLRKSNDFVRSSLISKNYKRRIQRIPKKAALENK